MNTIREFLAQRPPGLLYHYTDAKGLLGIIENKEIWATSAFHLNDAKEYRYAIELFQHELNKRVREGHISPDLGACPRKV